MHTLPLSHAPRRESGAPHRFPGHAHRAAPHPRAGMLKNTCLLTSGIFEATPGTCRLRAGSPGLGSGTATAHTRLSARGGPQSPPYAALPQFSCMGKTVFFRIHCIQHHRPDLIASTLSTRSTSSRSYRIHAIDSIHIVRVSSHPRYRLDPHRPGRIHAVDSIRIVLGFRV